MSEKLTAVRNGRTATKCCLWSTLPRTREPTKEKAAAFAEGYKAFLNAKTEREAAAASEKPLPRPAAKAGAKRPMPQSEDLLCAGAQGGGGRYHRPEI